MARLDYFAPGVYVEEVSRGSRPIQGISMSVAGFVGFTEDVRNDAELYKPTLITSWTQYLENFARIGSDGFTNFGAFLPFAIKGWFENGGGRCWIVSVGTKLPRRRVETPDHSERALSPCCVMAMTTSQRPSLSFCLRADASPAGRIVVVVQPDEPAEPEADSDVEMFDTGEYFRIRVEHKGQELETYRHLTMAQYPDMGINVVDALADSEYIYAEAVADPGLLPAAQRPDNGFYELWCSQEDDISVEVFGRRIYGTRKNRSGIQGLFEIDEVAMVACPDLMLAYKEGFLSLDQVHGVMEAMVTGCESAAPSPSYRMAVLDVPPVQPYQSTAFVSPAQQKPQDAEAWLERFNRRSPFAALYYPWIKVLNPRSGKPTLVPPCGHMMGVWCRTDETRGVHKAPANEVPRGILGLAYETNFREQEFLNPRGINCIRKFRDRGHLVWGARTLAQLDDTEWRYISVRRLMSYLEKSIELGTQWAVFEPNDEDLWARVTRTVRNFLERIWREGALFGSTPEEAFYVRCDSELNTPETMKLGLLYIEVGVAPVRPAEFVVFRVSQWDPTQGAGS
ncbi:phage tail sheath family protein [Nodosilinea sp. LEGE 07088]|uniref:phage tail sheath family protein n=1 Tax=Nodosilinea sp. LEGE 07088 TaxID=2777968 RepID=UPI0018828560|nr:phage tail sheath C-terminal domain-containing protein [Nodosilinea sp. LEGE 07088]MBE9140926.1 phage tail sheath family protein [Nodosilinea sp. LEGE 07088]